jgi:hypothetical protein
VLQITKAGRNRIASDECVDEAYQFARKIAARPEPSDWQEFLVRTARILTSTENNPAVSDAEVAEFIRENDPVFMEVRRAVREAVQMLEAGNQVH